MQNHVIKFVTSKHPGDLQRAVLITPLAPQQEQCCALQVGCQAECVNCTPHCNTCFVVRILYIGPQIVLCKVTGSAH
jgi:hypothetical protein